MRVYLSFPVQQLYAMLLATQERQCVAKVKVNAPEE